MNYSSTSGEIIDLDPEEAGPEVPLVQTAKLSEVLKNNRLIPRRVKVVKRGSPNKKLAIIPVNCIEYCIKSNGKYFVDKRVLDALKETRQIYSFKGNAFPDSRSRKVERRAIGKEVVGDGNVKVTSDGEVDKQVFLPYRTRFPEEKDGGFEKPLAFHNFENGNGKLSSEVRNDEEVFHSAKVSGEQFFQQSFLSEDYENLVEPEVVPNLTGLLVPKVQNKIYPKQNGECNSVPTLKFHEKTFVTKMRTSKNSSVDQKFQILKHNSKPNTAEETIVSTQTSENIDAWKYLTCKENSPNTAEEKIISTQTSNNIDPRKYSICRKFSPKSKKVTGCPEDGKCDVNLMEKDPLKITDLKSQNIVDNHENPTNLEPIPTLNEPVTQPATVKKTERFKAIIPSKYLKYCKKVNGKYRTDLKTLSKIEEMKRKDAVSEEKQIPPVKKKSENEVVEQNSHRVREKFAGFDEDSGITCYRSSQILKRLIQNAKNNPHSLSCGIHDKLNEKKIAKILEDINEIHSYCTPPTELLYYTKKIEVLDGKGRKVRTEHLTPNGNKKKKLKTIIKPCCVVIKRDARIEKEIGTRQKKMYIRKKLDANFKKQLYHLRDPKLPIMVLNKRNIENFELNCCDKTNVVYLKKLQESYPESVYRNIEFVEKVLKGEVTVTSPEGLQCYFSKYL